MWYLLTLCLLVHGPDFWVFDWEYNKPARVLTEKRFHLFFLQMLPEVAFS